MGVFNLLISPPIYYASGAHDIKQIIGGTVTGVAFGLLCGNLAGYNIDMFRDLTGVKESTRVPKFIRNKSSRMKLGLAALITAASIALTGAIYKATPDKNNEIHEEKETAKIYQEYSPKSLGLHQYSVGQKDFRGD